MSREVRAMPRPGVFAGLFLATLLLATPLGDVAHAQWQQNGSPVVTEAGDQERQRSVVDGAGGAIIAWQDRRGANWDIYAQRIGNAGNLVWRVDGIRVSSAADDQTRPEIVSDAAGGAIIAWDDRSNGLDVDIYAQRLNANGSTLWGLDPIPIVALPGDQRTVSVWPDGSGGVLIAWEDTRNVPTGTDIYVQRVNSLGAPQWLTDGLPVCTAATNQTRPIVISDGSGGAIVAWQDGRSADGGDIYAQRVDGSGVLQWQTNGIPVCRAANAQTAPRLVRSLGGAVIVWTDDRTRAGLDVYAQRVSTAGDVLWTIDGNPVSQASGVQQTPRIVSDGNEGAIIAWRDGRNVTTGPDIYAQRMTSAGAANWTIDGVALCTAADEQTGPELISDGIGGAIVTWSDRRDFAVSGWDVYAQRVTDRGDRMWATNGVALTRAAQTQSAVTIVPYVPDGAIVAWEDSRNAQKDVYAGRVRGDGRVAVAFASVDAVYDGSAVRLHWQTSDDGSLRGFNVYRAAAVDGDFHRLNNRLIPAGQGNVYTDPGVGPGETHWYRIGAVDGEGEWLSRVVAVTTAPAVMRLDQNYPNPFNPSTRISFAVATPGHVRIVLHDAAGRVVRHLVDEHRDAGTHGVTWDGTNDRGGEVASGAYYYTMTTPAGALTRRLVVLR